MYPLPSSLSLQNPAPSLVFPRTHLKTGSFFNTWSKFSVKCKRSEYYEQQRFSSPAEGPSSQQPLGGQFSSSVIFLVLAFANSCAYVLFGFSALPPRVFVGYTIYKGKAALAVEPKAPEFLPLDSGAYKVSKEGFVLLQFAPAAGLRQYDWSRKQVFSLSVTEIGSVMGLGAKDSCEFFHDPFKGKSEEGQVRKLLKAEPLPDGSGHFFNLSVQNRLLNVDESFYIPITKAEFTVLASAFNFILPYLLGWNAFGNTIRPDESIRTNNATQSGADFEWGK